MLPKSFICLLLSSFIVLGCIAQRTITGRVVFDSTKPLAGVTVEIENTVVSTITDKNGNYAISAGDDAVLIFKLAGYRTQEVQVHGRSIIDVNLERSSINNGTQAGSNNRVMFASQPCPVKSRSFALAEQVFDIVPGEFFNKACVIGN